MPPRRLQVSAESHSACRFLVGMHRPATKRLPKQTSRDQPFMHCPPGEGRGVQAPSRRVESEACAHFAGSAAREIAFRRTGLARPPSARVRRLPSSMVKLAACQTSSRVRETPSALAS